MQELSPLELLDRILLVLNEETNNSKGVNPHIRFFPLLEQVRADRFDVQAPDFELALEKLEEDKYMKPVKGLEIKGDNPFDEPNEYPAYAITFKGRAFNLQNGYAGEVQLRLAESRKVETLASAQHELGKGLNVVTAWIAVGTIALVLIELWKMALEYHWFSCH